MLSFQNTDTILFLFGGFFSYCSVLLVFSVTFSIYSCGGEDFWLFLGGIDSSRGSSLFAYAPCRCRRLWDHFGTAATFRARRLAG